MSIQELEQKFIDKCKSEVSEMLEVERGSEYCENVYQKYRSIFLMLDMIKLIEHKNNPNTEGLIKTMKNVMESKLDGTDSKK